MPLWELIDRRWNGKLHKPIHATGYFLNPKYYFADGSNFELDDEISSGLYLCLEKMVGHGPQKVQQLQRELSMYRGVEGYLPLVLLASHQRKLKFQV